MSIELTQLLDTPTFNTLYRSPDRHPCQTTLLKSIKVQTIL